MRCRHALMLSYLIIAPIGINHTWLSLTWTPDLGLITLGLVFFLSERDFLGLLLFSKLLMTHTKIVVELEYLLKAFASTPCCFYSPPDPTDLHNQPPSSHSGKDSFSFSFLSTKHHRPFGPQMSAIPLSIRVTTPSLEGLIEPRIQAEKWFTLYKLILCAAVGLPACWSEIQSTSPFIE